MKLNSTVCQSPDEGYQQCKNRTNKLLTQL